MSDTISLSEGPLEVSHRACSKGRKQLTMNNERLPLHES